MLDYSSSLRLALCVDGFGFLAVETVQPLNVVSMYGPARLVCPKDLNLTFVSISACLTVSQGSLSLLFAVISALKRHLTQLLVQCRRGLALHRSATARRRSTSPP